MDSWPVIVMPGVHPKDEVVLLTWATGGIGANVLDMMYRSSHMVKIYALVRGVDALSRLE